MSSSEQQPEGPVADERTVADASADARSRGWWILLPSLLLLLFAVRGQITGDRTLSFRDIGNFHLPAKFAQLEAVRGGELPFVDSHRGGQPSLGNPNTVPLYPDNLLYLLAPFWWAFNAHFWLHLLLAPASGFLLGRAWGLGRPASWACGISYTTGGFFLSVYGSFYNLIPAASLAPLLLAAVVRATSSSSRRSLWLAGLGITTALLLLGGDPVLASISFLAAALAVVLAPSPGVSAGIAARLRGSVAVALAACCGVLVALPQYVEMLRILPASLRGVRGGSDSTLLQGSFNPVQVVDWLMPFALGRPNVAFWGQRFFPEEEPLFFTVHAGLLVLALVLAAGRPSAPGQRWAWWTIGGGLFLSLGGHNPVVTALSGLPGADVFRFPIKFWLLVALGASVLVGFACERLLRGEGRTALRRALLVLFLIELLLLVVVVEGRGRLAAWAAGAEVLPQRLEEIWRFWLANGVLATVLLGGYLLLVWVLARRPLAMVAGLVALHTATQLLWLAPLIATDERSSFSAAPPLRRYVAADELVVHGAVVGSFPADPRAHFPNRDLRWIQHLQWASLTPFAGVLLGVDYELVPSPEGLDSHFSFRTLATVRNSATDRTRLRIVQALGVDALIVSRPLDADALDLAELRGTSTFGSVRSHLYDVRGAAPDILVTGDVARMPDLGAMLDAIVDPGFDAATMVVIAGPSGHTTGAAGTAEILRESLNEVVARVESATPSVVMVERAWLPIYRATIDGRPAPIVLANLMRLAVEVPLGEHEVRFWVDQRPFFWSLLAVPLGLGGIGLLAWWARRDNGESLAGANTTIGEKPVQRGKAAEECSVLPARAQGAPP